MANKKAPELRFKGFTDDWEQRKLGEVINFLNGRAYKQQELLETGKYRVLRVGNFNTNDKWYYSNMDLAADKYANPGDLLYLWATNFGPEIWDEEKVIYHYHIWKLDIHSNKVDKQYLYTWLITDKEKIKQTTNGTTMAHVTKGNMEQREFQIPKNIKEQKKIGSFFKQLDDTITLHQRKLEQLQVLKQAYLQQMFPSDTEKVPKLRFANFNKEWELCQLSSRVENIGTGNSTFTSNTPKSCENPFGVLGSTSVISYDSHFDYSGDFILTARVGANAGELYTHSGSIKISDNTVYIQASNLKFVFYLLINYDLKRLSYGTGQPLVKTSELKKLKMNFPSKSSEENKIGLFLATLENTIALHQHKLEQMKNLKQAYLQKMFI